MNQTAICFDFCVNSVLHFIWSNTVAEKASDSNEHRLTACLSVRADETKLSPFVVFNEKTLGYVDNCIDVILPDGVYSC